MLGGAKVGGSSSSNVKISIEPDLWQDVTKKERLEMNEKSHVPAGMLTWSCKRS